MAFLLPALHSEESREVTRESLTRSLATGLARHNWEAYSQAMLLFFLFKPIALLAFSLPALHSEESREVTRESLARSLATRLARHNWGAYSQAMLLFCLLKPIALLAFLLPALHSEESREVTRESFARSLATRLAHHNWGAYSHAMFLFCLLKPIAILTFLLPSPSPSSDRKVPKNLLQTCKILAEDFVTYHLSWFCLSSCMFWWTSYSNFVSFAIKLKSR